MTTRAAHQTEIHYPETDGMPLPDGYYQDPLFREIVTTIEAHYQNRPDVAVSGNTFVYYHQGDPQRFIAPDCYVALGISKASIERYNTYRIWEVGKPPDFALEIGSPSTARHDLIGKRQLYARIGIGEYWRYDATGGAFYGEPLVGEYLENGQYHRFPLNHEPDGAIWSHSPTLNLTLHWQNGRLRFHNPATNQWLLSYHEQNAARQAAETQARAAESQARAAETQARAAEAQARFAQQSQADAEARANRAETQAQAAQQARADAEAQAREAQQSQANAEAHIRELQAKLRQLRGESP